MFTGLGMGFGGGLMVLMGLVMVLFWVVLIVGAVWLARRLFPNGQQPPASSSRPEASADDILKQRYARGEISQEQYNQMHRDLIA
jgi:putative membrane protein